MRKLLLLPILALACGGGAEAEEKLAAVEKEAKERVAKVEREAKAKVEAAERQIEQLKTELAEAKSKAEEAIKARDSAEEQAKIAEAAIAKARQAYKDKARLQLAELNKELADVAAKAGKVPAKSKAAFTTALKDARKQQTVVAKDIAEFDKATLETFKTVNSKLATDLAVLKAKIRAAKAKIS